jgi:murein tripeptide amidase MpaA
MRPAIYSYKKESIGWHSGGDRVRYYANGFRISSTSSHSLFTLTFAYTFPFDDDEVYFAYSYPYTFTQLNEYLNKLEENNEVSNYFSRKTLCRTLAGNKCECITITAANSKAEKQGVCLTARTHPGETVGSWMMQGILEFTLRCN